MSWFLNVCKENLSCTVSCPLCTYGDSVMSPGLTCTIHRCISLHYIMHNLTYLCRLRTSNTTILTSFLFTWRIIGRSCSNFIRTSTFVLSLPPLGLVNLTSKVSRTETRSSSSCCLTPSALTCLTLHYKNQLRLQTCRIKSVGHTR